ncbi:MAG: hypothetical protein RLZZ350_473 [Verrucomicrobiota bacterium]|jgi:hypothetical protein
MKTKIHFPLLIALALLAGCSKKSTDQPAEKPTAEKAEVGPSVKRGADGEPIVTLDAETQKRIALKTESLAATDWTPEVKGFGRVVDTATLAAALADLETARGAEEVSGKELARLQTLAKQGNASDRVLQTAEAAAKHDGLALDAARAKFAMSWGKKLADDSGDTLKLLAAGEAVLVQIALPGGDSLKSAPASARIASLNDAAKFVSADFFDAGAGVDPMTQQQSFLFLAKQSSLTPGAAVTGFLKTGGAAVSGVTIPADAILRHDGKAWIYLQTGDDEFSRREITLDRATDGGWFTSELSATNKVVTSGAQMVLSTELSAGGFTTGARD